MSSLTVAITGRVVDPAFHQACILAKSLRERFPHMHLTTHPQGEAEFSRWVATTARGRGERDPVVFVNERLVGDGKDFAHWAQDEMGFQLPLSALHGLDDAVRQAFATWVGQRTRPLVFVDWSLGDEEARRVVIELQDDVCPRSVENFRALCTGEAGESESGVRLSFEGTPVHRVQPDGWIQSGDIVGGHGDGSESIFGGLFEDESFQLRHDRTGVVGYAHAGRPHSNGSQFYITLRPTPWFDESYVAFGYVVSGMDTVSRIARLPTLNSRPETPCRIVKSGVFTAAVASGDAEGE